MSGSLRSSPIQTITYRKLQYTVYYIYLLRICMDVTCCASQFGLKLNTLIDMGRLTTGIRSENCVVRRFLRCANMYKPR
jgi:hypothetical protein